MSDPIQNLGAYGSAAADFGSSFMQGLYYMMFVLILVAILGFIAYRLSFKCKVRLRYLTNSFDKVKDVPGKLAVDRHDGIEKLFVLHKGFKKLVLPAPPSDAISLNMKGKDCFEIEIPPDGTPRYIVKDTNERTYAPFNSNDRVFYLNEIEKIESRRKKSIHDLISAAIPYIFILIVFIGLIAFWGDIVEPFNRAGETNLAIMQENAKITGMLKEIIKKEQVVSGEVEVLQPPGNSSRPPD